MRLNGERLGVEPPFPRNVALSERRHSPSGLDTCVRITAVRGDGGRAERVRPVRGVACLAQAKGSDFL
jgi:hypothetical protein